MTARPPRSRPAADSGLTRHPEAIRIGGGDSVPAEPPSSPPAPASPAAPASAPAPVSAAVQKRLRRDLNVTARQYAAARRLESERAAEWETACTGARSAGLPADTCERMIEAARLDADLGESAHPQV